MKLLYNLPICILLLFIGAPTIAQETASMTLLQAQEYAMKNSFSVKSAESDAKSAELQTDELIGIGLPQVSASLQYQNFLDLPTSIVPGEFFGMPGQDARLQFGVPHQMTAGLSASQLLFDGSWLVGLQASRAYARMQEQQVAKSRSDIRLETAEAYHLVLIAQKNVELLTEGRAVLQQMLDETTALWNEGFVEEQDVDQLKLSLIEWDNRITNAQAQVQLTKDLLKFTIGMPLATQIELTDSADALMTGATPEMLSSPFNLETDLEYQLAQSGLGMQQLNLKNQKARLLPNLAAFYNLQSQALRRDFNFTDTSLPWFPIQVWGFQLNVPIFSGGGKMKSIERAEVEVQRMTDTVNLTREASLLEYNNARTEYSNALANYQSTRASYELSMKILDKTRIKFREGVGSSFEVSQATSQALQSQGNYVQAMLALMNAKTKLEKALNQF